jgi:Na+-transporting NADH:ubiquinone oxidoreductase subunit NqrF
VLVLAVVSFRVIPAVLVALLLSSSAAKAASIANRDDRDHSVHIIEGEARLDHVLKPNAVLEGVCGKGCLIRLDDNRDDPFELEGSEVTSIEEGQLYSDEPAERAEPGDGDAGQPSRPGSRDR